jgi:hypothetical protein
LLCPRLSSPLDCAARAPASSKTGGFAVGKTVYRKLKGQGLGATEIGKALGIAGSYAGLITAAAMESNQSSPTVPIERSSDAQRPSNIRKSHLAEARER